MYFIVQLFLDVNMDLKRMELIPWCQTSLFSGECRDLLSHTPSQSGICTVFNGDLISNIFVSSEWRTEFENIYNVGNGQVLKNSGAGSR